MGGGSETVKGAQVMGLSKEYGKLKKKVLLETGKFISNGMDIVVKAKTHNIVDMKSMYNKPYLNAMGYAPSDNILINKISEGKVLEYTINHIDSRATQIYSPEVRSLGTMDQVILALQDKPNFKRSVMTFTHTDGKKYVYYTAVQNGMYIDISCYLNNIDTVTPYLANKYPDGYILLSLSSSPLEVNGSMYWTVEVEYTYYEDETIEEIVVVNGKPTVVQKVIKVKKTAIASDNIDCVFIYISAQDVEESNMYAIAQQYSGPFTTTGSYTVENDETGGYTHNVIVTGTFTVTYIGNGEFSYDMDAPPPFDSSYRYSNSRLAWDNGVMGYKTEKMLQINQYAENSIRRLIWDYKIDGGDFDSARRTFAEGSILDSVIVKEYADTYPIIPLKKWFQLVNSKNMDIVLKKIGIEGKDFHESIRQKEICDAYLFFGIPYSPGNPGLIQYIFEFFTTLANVRENFGKFAKVTGNDSVNISFDGMGILQNYRVESWIVKEPATRSVRTYWYQKATETIISGYEERTFVNENGMSEEETVPIYETKSYDEFCYQESEDYYIKVRPMGIQYWYILGGEFWGTKRKNRFRDSPALLSSTLSEQFASADDKVELRIPILKQITNKMDFNLLCDVIEQSMSFAVFTSVTVKKKWYQSGFFKFVVIVVIIVIAYFTGGAALAALGPVMGVVVAGAIYLSALMTVITMVTGTSFGVFGTIVGIIAAVGGGYASLLNAGMTVTQTVMFTASQVLSLVGQVNDLLFSMKMSSRQKENDKTLGAQEAEKEKLSEEYDKLHENEGMIVNMFNNFKSLDDIDNYYNMAVGDFDSYYLMLDYGTDYSKFYKI